MKKSRRAFLKSALPAAAASGKSLTGNSRIEVFAGRVLDLAKNPRKARRTRKK